MAGLDAAVIGSDDNYIGSANLGGATFGVLNIDTKPLSQLAAYTTMYNKSVWEKEQQDTDAKVAQLANLSNIALNNLRGKDKDLVAKDFTQLQKDASDYARKIPKNAQEKLQNELDWQTKYGAFLNNYNSGKGRSVSYMKRLNDIKTSIPDAKAQDVAITQLDSEFNSTDIGTQISATPNYKLETIDVPDPTLSSVNFVAVDGNDNLDVEAKIFISGANTGKADAMVVGIGNAYPKKTIKDANGKDVANPAYESLSENEKSQAEMQGTVVSNGKIWTDMTDPLNAALNNPKYKDADGKFIEEKFKTDFASNSVVMTAYTALKKMDSDQRGKYNQAVARVFNDKGVSFKLPDNVNPDSFKAGLIDFSNPITPSQLALAGIFSKHNGDVYQKKVTHTGDQKAFDLEKMRELNALKMKNIDEGGANYRAGLDLIGKGFTRDAKGKWVAPTKATDVQAGGVIPYWQNYILPQLSTGGLKITNESGGFLGYFKNKTETDVPKDYTGDVEVPADKVSGLGIVLTGDLDENGKQKSYNSETKTKIRFEKGQAVGVVIDGVFHDQNQINTKATVLNDKTVSNKYDANIYGASKDTPAAAAAGKAANGADYYNNQSNMQSQVGNVITYKDGSVWIYDDKTGQLNPKK